MSADMDLFAKLLKGQLESRYPLPWPGKNLLRTINKEGTTMSADKELLPLDYKKLENVIKEYGELLDGIGQNARYIVNPAYLAYVICKVYGTKPSEDKLVPLDYHECINILNNNREYNGQMDIHAGIMEICRKLGTKPSKELSEDELKEIICQYDLSINLRRISDLAKAIVQAQREKNK
jgi:hypothetical protein